MCVLVASQRCFSLLEGGPAADALNPMRAAGPVVSCACSVALTHCQVKQSEEMSVHNAVRVT